MKNEPVPYTNEHRDDRMLIVLSAPLASTAYYQDVYDEIIDFQIAYAQAVMEKDNIVILGDRQALRILEQDLPPDILLKAKIGDIWMRDFTTINPFQTIQFRYAAAAQSGSQRDADWIQTGFARFTDRLNITYPYTDWILDGGNVVDNHKDKAIVTERFLEDNNLPQAQAKEILKELLQVEQVAIIPADDVEGLAHADGMVMFIEENTLVLNRYDEPFRSQVIQELVSAFSGIEIVEVETQFDEEIWDERFGSACGIYTNSLVTQNYIYMPIFSTALDESAIQTIQSHTTKTVVPINANQVCFMGGSVRCLGWQIVGDRAKKIINAARNDSEITK